MVRLVDWLARRKALNVALVLVYSVVILVMHDPMVNVSIAIMEYFTWQLYDAIVASLAVAALLGIVYFFFRKLRQNRHAIELKTGYLIIIVSLLFLHTQINFVLYIELIHTIEFGILAILIFPLVKRFGDTAFYTLLVGCADEWYQYKVLYTEKIDSNYFDFNDLALDLLGIGFALLLLYTAGINNKSYPPKIKWYRSPVLYAAGFITLSVTALFQAGLIQLYGANPDAWLVLNKAEGPQGFWMSKPDSNIVYHVMQPLEGVVILISILTLFFLFDYWARQYADSNSPLKNEQTAERRSRDQAVTVVRK